ncbi:adenosylcobinamide-GDP ribazoletransferase [Lysobacter pythonis]|uniref:Adenosylcobinamide-GDP ribazoletransferase n=1 Tax=Solilutibacter pythonis TaxID=2483112 RepID=A0A3M2HWZ3_9GAMM|nr:adenosylcobinamide-GDP ribazoletransferase [Lysobacter pythonis]RMH94231.1 adenosylcobinamide-GDP ribazoletransferase [Lysobacter pythonis]
MMRAFLHALGFLTRIPVPARVFGDAGARRGSLPFYPPVGALIGAVLLGIGGSLGAAPPLLAAAIVLAAWVMLTGALHLDGLADSADAWVGGLGNREKTLAIMKDPASGPVGVAAVVLVLLLKFAALASLPPAAWPAVLIAPMLARTWLVLAFLTTPYVRGGGMGAALADAPRIACWLACAFAMLVAAVAGRPGVVALLAGLSLFALWRRAVMKRLGGFTGDTAGALAELAEAVMLVAMALTLAR